MIADCTIQIKNLHKHFKLYGSPKSMLKELILGKKCHAEFHALKDISFTVKRGEVVGVMGRNGAGKSTLLRILAGTLDATSGCVETNGRVSAILELGTGFNPEYTGRENIVSGGLVLGMSKDEIQSKIAAIIEFSELENFIDNPFKTYSSGMQARLTFATAISVNPAILIVDEALSVGDAEFQAKCYARIQKMRDEGTSIFLVSHSENAITHFCDRCLLLEKGELLMDASPREVTMAYTDMIWAKKKLTRESATQALPNSETCSQEKNIPAISEEEFDNIVRCPEKLNEDQRQKLKSYLMHKHGIPPFIPSKLARRMGERECLEIVDFGIFTLDGKRVQQLTHLQKYQIKQLFITYEDSTFHNSGYSIRTLSGIVVCGATAKLNNHLFLESEIRRGTITEVTINFTCYLVKGPFLLTMDIVSENNTEIKIADGFRDSIEFFVLDCNHVFNDTLVSLQESFNCGKV